MPSKDYYEKKTEYLEKALELLKHTYPADVESALEIAHKKARGYAGGKAYPRDKPKDPEDHDDPLYPKVFNTLRKAGVRGDIADGAAEAICSLFHTPAQGGTYPIPVEVSEAVKALDYLNIGDSSYVGEILRERLGYVLDNSLFRSVVGSSDERLGELHNHVHLLWGLMTNEQVDEVPKHSVIGSHLRIRSELDRRGYDHTYRDTLDEITLSLEQSSPQGVMVYLKVPGEVSRKVDHIGLPGDPVESLHLTLAYLGEVGELTPDQLDDIKMIVEGFAEKAPPIIGSVSGSGKFAPIDGKYPLYLSFDSPQLPTWRQHLVSQLNSLLKRNHGFSPHITLAWVDQDQYADITLPSAIPCVFDTVGIGIGDEYTEVRLRGDPGRVYESEQVDWSTEWLDVLPESGGGNYQIIGYPDGKAGLFYESDDQIFGSLVDGVDIPEVVIDGAHFKEFSIWDEIPEGLVLDSGEYKLGVCRENSLEIFHGDQRYLTTYFDWGVDWMVRAASGLSISEKYSLEELLSVSESQIYWNDSESVKILNN